MLSLSLLYGNSDLNGMEETRSIGSDSDSVLEANLSQNQVKTCLVSRDNHSIHFFRERACTFRQEFNTYNLILVGRCILSSLSWIIFTKKRGGTAATDRCLTLLESEHVPFDKDLSTIKLILFGCCILISLSWMIFTKKKRRDGSNVSLTLF